MEAQTSEVADARGLVEHVEVAEGKLLGDRLLDLEDRGVLALLAVVLAELDGARADLALDRESHRIGSGGDLHGLAEREELLADLGVLAGVDGDHRLVLGLGDGQVLAVNSDQVQVELSLALVLRVLEDDLQVSGLLVGLQGDGV